MKKAIHYLLFLSININLFAATVVLQNPAVNQDAPVFSGIDSYGEQINLSDFKGQPVILEWTNHECPYVAKHYSENNMQAVQKMAQDEGIIWLSIVSSTPGDQGHINSVTANELTQSRNAYPSHVLLDESGEIGMQYGAKTTPHMYMIDSDGILRYKGAIDDVGRGMKFFSASLKDAMNYVALQIDDLKNANQLDISSTVPYGCSVKYNYD
ncbi:MAG: thioredoxin family protein [Gammaproteobacteria bacterium]|nr:thioredoxin family protein [Gammaproteobacteria bacterium]|tara:strand:- start:853 stop:1485 length:633 start_codon:yes stop_codon:yes gene_type:complete